MKSAPTAVKMLLCATLAAVFAPVIARAAWLDGFAFRRQIEVDCSKIDAPLTNFPALVRLTTNNFDFAKARPDGFDVRFAAGDGQTLLAFERERHDTAAEAAEYWVKLPLVAADSNTVFYMYYGCPSAADGADATNVWDAHFAGVWHKNDLTTGSVKDSTTNANNGTKGAANQPLETNGKINRAQDYNPGNYYINVPNRASLNITPHITISFWAKVPAAPGSYGMFLSKDYTQQYAVMAVASTRRVRCDMQPHFKYMDELWTTEELPVDTWTQVSCSFDGTKGKIYFNDSVKAEKTKSGAINTGASALAFGRNSAGNYPVNAVIDEIRISNVARSHTWVTADYHSGNDTLLICGGEQVRPTGFFNAEFF